MPQTEELLWSHLRGGRLQGIRFRRQHPIDPYIVDFCALRLRVIVELDGDSHIGREDVDRIRQEYLESKGYLVLRFWNNDCYESIDGVLESIYQACLTRQQLKGCEVEDKADENPSPGTN
jgi:very-short-patch-repair endonuclease